MTVEKVITVANKNVVDIIEDVVTAVRAEYDPTDGLRPFYLHGHPLEIFHTLNERSGDDTLKYQKYPAIILFEDYESSGASGIFKAQTKLNIVIITDTLPDYDAGQRYTNSFDLILTPIYKLFMKHALRSRRIYSMRNSIDHTPINRLYWGKTGLYGNEGKILNDNIDAIEIQDFDCKINRKND